jgi:NADPH:quinone reductase-like Zn-dependent oxidoreductase
LRALVITRHGPPDVLQVQERPDPEPGPGEVRIRVRAAGMNFSDLLARVGFYPDAPDPPCVIGYEVAGEVDSVGPGVDGVEPGQRVIAGTRFGGQAELAVADAATVVPLPDGWSFEQGAAMPVNYATAYAGLVRYGAVRRGERVLLQAAAGGVGTAAVQIAKAAGAEIFGTASARKHDAIRELGVDHPIDYRSTDFAKEVRRITGERSPLDLVLDGVGGSSFRKGYSLLRAGGRLVCIGVSAVQPGEEGKRLQAIRAMAQMPIFHPVRMMQKSKAVIGINMLTLWDEHGSLAEYIEPLRGWAENGEIDPVVAEAFSFDRAADAHRAMHEGRNVGKLVLTP